MAQDIDLTNLPQKKTRKKREKPVDKQLVTALLADGYSKVHIADKVDCTPQSVRNIEKSIDQKSIQISEFLRDRANIFAYYQRQHLDLIRDLKSEIKKALEAGQLKPSDMGKIVFYLDSGVEKYHRMERLETGKSTQNTAILQSFMVQSLGEV